MTIKQKLVLFAGFTAIALMLIYPPIRFMVSNQTPGGVSVHTEIRYELLFTESVKGIYFFRLILQSIIVLAATLGLLCIFARREKTAAQRARGLAEVNEKLHQELTESAKVENDLRKQLGETTALNKKLRHEIDKVSKAVNNWLEYRNQLEQRLEQQSLQLAAAQKTAPPEITKPKETRPDGQENQNLTNSQEELADPKYDMIRERMVSEIERLNEFIKSNNL